MIIKDKSLKYNIAKKLYHLSVKIDNSNNSNFETNGEKKFIKNLFDDLKNKDSLILIDVGGNIGDYTQMLFENAIKLNGTFQIHVFEPTKYCYSMLSKRFRDKRVYLNNTACSNIDRSAKIYYDSVGSGLASMHNRNLKAIGNELKIKETIKTQRLDDYIKKCNICHIDFIKVDVEGHEKAVFEGMGDFLNPDFVDYVQFEYGGANLDSMTSLMNLYELFEFKGFVLAKIMPKGLQVRNYEPFLENFEYSNYVAISKKVIKV
ncbi:methyltransferase FkbM family [Methanosalsum zhilinae DSM 4017]|uniref:Methyltransferase FkbM family n=1 Tax=Methanosalsum zhilinae (strain DSM 4017 / NBRC 107636 / OCM 62 / WeN5) TaxID=679901 RepID=F7XPW1_METZD|nr:FkbM family methyltransferase [Methanosalsum zhilinae]AEH61482.1 methyltransferase FkbM family [Methanosalsum zhilinae DSM 4017]